MIPVILFQNLFIFFFLSASFEDIIKRNVSSGLLLPKLTFLFISPFSLVRATFPVPIGYPMICLATYTPLADA